MLQVSLHEGAGLMSDLTVRIVRLEPMRVACIRVVSVSPERDAWEKLRAWVAPKGLLDNPAEHPVFGFNNPNPSTERQEYGYEFWIGVGPDVSGEGEIEVKEFAGGLFASTTCRLVGDSAGSVPEIWRKLWEWVQVNGGYRWRKAHELEQCRNPQAAEADIELDLHLPIEKRPHQD